MSNNEQDLEKQYENDLKDLVDTYRTLKNLGKWVGALFAFILVIATILLTLKNLK